MCTGVEIALIVGAAVAATATVAQAQGEAQAGRDRARLFAAQAERRKQEGRIEAQDFRQRNRRVLAAQRAAFAAAGVQPQGTPIGVGADTAKEIELTAQRILVGAELESEGLGISSRFERRAASQASTGGFLRAGSTLLTGFGRTGTVGGTSGGGGITGQQLFGRGSLRFGGPR